MSAHEEIVCVVGLGRSGEAAARFLASGRGSPSKIVVVDAADDPGLRERADALRGLGVEVVLGATEVAGADLVVMSPGVPPSSALARSALALGVPVISELELAFRESCSPWVAVTGTNGKTTVTSMIAHLLNESGVPAEPLGNIGPPAVRVASEAGAATVLVAEVSSFQLAHTESFHPRVAVLLNITPDHLDWHGSLEAYTSSKARIFENLGQGDTAIIDVDDPGSTVFADPIAQTGARVVRVSRQRVESGGAYLVDGTLTVAGSSGGVPLVRADELQVRGDHNVGNALAAAAAALAAGATYEGVREGLRSFRPVEHRLEPVGVVRGVEYVNDSKATNPESAIIAMRAFADRPLVVLLGGRSSETAFGTLGGEVATRCRGAVVFGEAAGRIAEAIRLAGLEPMERASMRDAVAAAAEFARPGDVVMLSPACKSFDEFEDFEDRGRTFKRLVGALGGAEAG